MSLLPILTNFVRNNPRLVILPVAIVVGFVGVNVEGWVRSPAQGTKPKSLMEERADRNLDSLDEDPTQVAALKDKTFVSKSSLEVNKVGGDS